VHYSIRHITRFRYDTPVRESVMELRMQPRSEGIQALRSFQIVTNPRAQLYAYTDYLGNAVYHFNVLREHSELRVETQSLIEMTDWARPSPPIVAWTQYDASNLSAEHFDFLDDSKFAMMTPSLAAFMAARNLEKPFGDPASALQQLNRSIYEAFDYKVGVTEVDSPIDDALKAQSGVCQDFAHVMIAIARHWGVPARYVSGYLYHRDDGKDRSGEDATHAWVESFLPGSGWVGFDPTNDVLTGERHIRVAVGRDYGDVPPTRGTYKGGAQSELAISVSVQPTQAPVRHEEFLRVARAIKPGSEPPKRAEQYYQQQQQ
jgi:transglutaminase-like putative cysteine protease